LIAIEYPLITPKLATPIQSQTQVQILKLIQNAQSWYWLARSTENSFQYYDNSEKIFDKAAGIAKKLPFEERALSFNCFGMGQNLTKKETLVEST